MQGRSWPHLFVCFARPNGPAYQQYYQLVLVCVWWCICSYCVWTNLTSCLLFSDMHCYREPCSSWDHITRKKGTQHYDRSDRFEISFAFSFLCVCACVIELTELFDKMGSMDVKHEDTIREAPKELMLLLPFIFVVQVSAFWWSLCLSEGHVCQHRWLICGLRYQIGLSSVHGDCTAKYGGIWLRFWTSG